MIEGLTRGYSWVTTWDWVDIFYGVVASLIFAALVRWSRSFGYFRRGLRNIRATFMYRRALIKECQHLIVVGRRAGFKMESTYVDLDVSPSDLSQSKGDPLKSVHGFAKPYVLVGGPGAGKSTLVKHLVLRALGSRPTSIPIFLKLRDYVGFESIESAIAHRFSNFRFGKSQEMVDLLLRSSETLCVLDGLDEVRVESRAEVIRHINQFFHKYFDQGGQIIVTCRKEAYRDTPLDIPSIMEVRPLSDEQIQRLAEKWPIAYPEGKSFQTFLRDLTAVPRIHELARSPLLLVGGLMQYTDSNQGIPDERFQYLNRIATWLIADWSTAQGHPPDPLRPLYDRVLPRLAYHMHQTKCAEIHTSEAVALVDSWLPQFGHPKGGAPQVIESIKTRTGILVSENAHHLIFAQFGLQEYFASLEVTEQVKPSDIPTLTPISWWREAILLAVAQQREPTAYLESLFTFDSFLAAAAVAECPTPSSVLQRRAVEACLRGIDKMETSVTGALVPLLRKVRGELEQTLVDQLASRLTGKKKKARIVGLALATAGTEACTEALAKHPEIWEECLRGAAYLSDSFEGMLLRWTESGSEDQSAKAADMLAERIRPDTLEKLCAILPRLSSSKAEHLALLLLVWVFRSSPPWSGLPTNLIGLCAPHIRDPKTFYSRARADLSQRGRPPWLGVERGMPFGILVALLLVTGRGERYTPLQIRLLLGFDVALRRLSPYLFGLTVASAYLWSAVTLPLPGYVLISLGLSAVFATVCIRALRPTWQLSEAMTPRPISRTKVALAMAATGLSIAGLTVPDHFMRLSVLAGVVVTLMAIESTRPTDLMLGWPFVIVRNTNMSRHYLPRLARRHFDPFGSVEGATVITARLVAAAVAVATMLLVVLDMQGGVDNERLRGLCATIAVAILGAVSVVTLAMAFLASQMTKAAANARALITLESRSLQP